MARVMPKSVVFEDDEGWRIDRARLALLLGRLPSEIDAIPAKDIWDLVAVHNDEQVRKMDKG